MIAYQYTYTVDKSDAMTITDFYSTHHDWESDRDGLD